MKTMRAEHALLPKLFQNWASQGDESEMFHVKAQTNTSEICSNRRSGRKCAVSLIDKLSREMCNPKLTHFLIDTCAAGEKQVISTHLAAVWTALIKTWSSTCTCCLKRGEGDPLWIETKPMVYCVNAITQHISVVSVLKGFREAS